MNRRRKCFKCGEKGKGTFIEISDKKWWKCPYCNNKTEIFKRTDEDFIESLKEQIQLLINSCNSFDNGSKIEAKNMISKIRTILYDTNNSQSLLNHLNKKDMLFYDAVAERDPRLLEPYMGLIELLIRPENIEYSPLFDRLPDRCLNRKTPFDEWWSETVVLEANKVQFTREDLIITMCNQDGGVHFDLELPSEYIDLIQKSLGISYKNDNKKPTINLNTNHNDGSELITEVELVNIRQITHELLKSLKDEFPEIFSEQNFKIPVPKDYFSDVIYIINPYTCYFFGYKKYLGEKIDFKGSETKIDINSLFDYIEKSETIEYWTKILESLGIEFSSMGPIYAVLAMLEQCGIGTLGELDDLLMKSKEWGENYFKGYLITSQRGESSFMTPEWIVMHLLIANFPHILTDNVLEFQYNITSPECFTVPAEFYNPNYNDE